MKSYSNKPPESQDPNCGAQNVQKPVAAEPREQAAQEGKPAPADRVDTPGWSKEVADLMSAINQLPDIREARVQDIKQRVYAGAYTIDPLKIAERILKNI